MKAKNILEVTDFSQSEWKKLISETIKFKKNPYRKKNLLKNKRIALVFDSNSLRTRLSFETAIHLLGGNSYFVDIHALTHEKDNTPRECYEDIIETMDRMVDAYVVRDYTQQMLEVFKRKSFPPIINGFCSTGHPSQALADLSVIKYKKKTNNVIYSGVCPEAGSGVMESFIYGVLLLGLKITLITETGKFVGKNQNFQQQSNFLEKKYGGHFNIVKNSELIIKRADVLYVDEWWDNSPNFLKRKIGKYKVDSRFLKKSKKTLSILHCMPAHMEREISTEVMQGEQSIVYDEAEFRVYSAMALLNYLSK